MSWQSFRLGDLYLIGSSKRVLKSDWQADGVPFYRGREITQLSINGYVDNELYITEKHYSDLIRKYGAPNEGDIMITAIGTIGNAYIVRKNDRFYFKDASVLWLKRTSDINSQFVNLWLQSLHFFEQLESGNGATVDTLSIQKLQSVKINVPPIQEQQRIVTILDQTFEGIAKARANAEQNLQNARALFESHLQSVFTQRGEGWRENVLKEICEKITDGTHQTPKYFDDGVIFLSSRNVTTGKIDWENIKYIDEKQHLEMQRRVSPKLNDILLAKNGTTGVAAMVDKDVPFDIYVSLALLRPLPLITPKLLLYFVNSSVAKQQFNKRLKGVGVPNLHLEEIREVEICFPNSLIEQEKITTELDKLREETQHLEALYQRKIACLDELKKSLLQQAFAGEL
jgi:type I restriction enzyme S subunit